MQLGQNVQDGTSITFNALIRMMRMCYQVTDYKFLLQMESLVTTIPQMDNTIMRQTGNRSAKNVGESGTLILGMIKN
ncbi:hypothetical protein A3I35_00515 [Candidatus Falkowbacteria bacterium RIFCSPLOWO2_02_FULL_45_15]|uniref:Uncharacterized protein n=1 Tax=Candidatus Falkowbacteria bacterium RIFCSPLOWO2_02_FULL_45_15 TaxID=1797988 RepID=A0A1F5S0A1_9BACT|nr:MAG: hypothetical protein A3I35_00515 [Candidatus Falkowbacteria bacterium RIFCSPLOWO2_02_FULL_45_15]